MCEMNLQRIVTGKTFCLVFVVSALLVLTGCWDVESRLDLRSDGGGDAVVYSRFNKGEKECRGSNIPQSPEKNPGMVFENTPNVQAVRYFMDGQCVIEERLSFASLAELPSEIVQVHLEDLGQVQSGSSQKRMHISQNFPYFEMLETFGKDSRNKRIGHMFSYLIALPGKIEEAISVRIDNRIYKPQIAGSTVRWDIPMDKMNSAVVLEATFLR